MYITVAYTTIWRWKSSFKLFYIEYRVYGYIVGAGTVLYLAGSLRYRRINQLCFNAPYLQCKSTLYTVFRCILQLLTRQYNVEKSSFKLLYIEYRVYGYIVGACTVPYMAGSLRYRRINQLRFNVFDVYYSCLNGNITLKKLLQTLVYWI